MVAYRVITVVIMVLTAWIVALQRVRITGGRPAIPAWTRAPGRCVPAWRGCGHGATAWERTRRRPESRSNCPRRRRPKDAPFPHRGGVFHGIRAVFHTPGHQPARL